MFIHIKALQKPNNSINKNPSHKEAQKLYLTLPTIAGISLVIELPPGNITSGKYYLPIATHHQ